MLKIHQFNDDRFTVLFVNYPGSGLARNPKNPESNEYSFFRQGGINALTIKKLNWKKQ